MTDFEENVEEMVGTTREAAAVATECGGDETATRPRTRRGRDRWYQNETGNEMAATAGEKTVATGGVLYTDEGELEFEEDEMAASSGGI